MGANLNKQSQLQYKVVSLEVKYRLPFKFVPITDHLGEVCGGWL